MHRFKSTDKSFLLLFLISIGMVIITIFIGTLTIYQNPNIVDNTTSLTEWKMDDGSGEQAVTLPTNIKPESDDTKYTFTYQLEDYHLSGSPHVMLSINFCNMYVYVDDQLIFSQVMHEDGLSKVDGTQYNLVALPSDYQNKTLKVEIEPVLGSNIRYKLREPILGSESSIIFYEISDDIVSLCLILFLFVVGLELILISCIAPRKEIANSSILPLGFSAFFCSLFLMCQAPVFHLLAPNTYVSYYVEYTTLPLLILSFIIIISKHVHGLVKKIYNVLTALAIIVIISEWIMNFIFKIDFRLTLIMSHLLVPTFIIAIIIALIRKDETDLRERKEIMLSVIPIAIGGLIDVNIYYMGLTDIFLVFSKVGLIIFIILQIYFNYRKYMERYRIRVVEKAYKVLAFKDVMTRLDNRRSFEDDITNLTTNTPENFTCLSIDVNNLKVINDTYGHAKGDEILQAMGTIINEATSKNGKGYRIGGDEFTIFIQEKNKSKEIIQQLSNSCNLYNSKHDVELSYAIGEASFDPTIDSSIKDTIIRSDNEMYENKRIFKQQKSS